MKKAIFKSSNNIDKQKKLYILLIGLAILAMIFGIIFVFLISEENLNQIKESLASFFDNIGSKNRVMGFFNAMVNNSTYIFIIWLLGISIIGLPIVIIIMMFKFFVFGFSMSSIIYTFKWGGILKAIIHLFPHHIMFLVALILVTFYSVSFCIKLFNYLFFKKNINFRDVMHRYIKVLLICILVNVFVSFYEAYVSTYLLNLLN